MNSHFSGLQNRQKINESKKVSRRESLFTKKSNLIEYGSLINEGEEYLPNPSELELKKIKNEIKEKIQSSNRKKCFLFAILFLLIITVLIFLSKKYNIF